MPYHIEKQGDEFAVVEDSGKVVGKHPTRQQAIEQQRALYANVPEASGKATADINDLPDAAFLHVEAGGKKDDTGRTVPRSLRHLPYKTESGAIDLPKLRNALSRLGQSATGESGGERWLSESLRNSLRAKAEKILADNTDAESATKEVKPTIIERLLTALKGDVPGHEFHGNQYDAGGGGGSSDSSDESWKTGNGGRAKESVRINGSNVRGKMTAAHVDREVNKPSGLTMSHSGGSFNFYRHSSGKIAVRGRGGELTDSQHIADVVNNKTGFKESLETKEGRRNSSNDAERLQQIHDLSVMNGADCPMIFKEASGRLRWVMLSSNSYQDTDKEIIAQTALEADVERADKERNYGPLRWWHVGNPDPITRTPGDGIDIGDCDFNAMHGRMLIESGTFRDERIGEAIKEHADTLAGSIGFFHPLNQPDSEGVFSNIQRFERSLLPRARASNQLTALTVTGDQDMATMKEKFDEFVGLLGGDTKLAQSVVNQAEQTEKAAHEAGLKFKAKDEKKSKGEEPETPEEDKAETEADEEAEGETPKKFEKKMTPEKKEVDYEEMAKGLEPHISKMIEKKMAESRKEAATKEAGLTKQIETLTAKLKEVEAVAKTLAGDLPRGVKDGYRASQSASTITTKEAPNQPAPDPLGDFYGWVTESLGHQAGGAQPVQPPGA